MLELKLKVGDKIPEFSGQNQWGETVSSLDFAGKKMIIFFYPKASTPGCTAEACDIQNNLDRFKSLGYEVLGVSADSVERQLKFSQKYGFEYALIADVNLDIIQKFGVWGPKKFMGKEYDGIHRTTFVVDEYGTISEIFTKVKTKAHSDQILGK